MTTAYCLIIAYHSLSDKVPERIFRKYEDNDLVKMVSFQAKKLLYFSLGI